MQTSAGFFCRGMGGLLLSAAAVAVSFAASGCTGPPASREPSLQDRAAWIETIVSLTGPDSNAVGLWSKPVNGLSCRIAGYDLYSGHRGSVFALLRNDSNDSLSVPVGEMRRGEPARLFEVRFLSSRGWQIVHMRAFWPGDTSEEEAGIRPLYLGPGQTVLVWLAAPCPPAPEVRPFLQDPMPEDMQHNSLVKLVLRASISWGPQYLPYFGGENRWAGELESPLHPIYSHDPNAEGTLPAPDSWPAFSPIPFEGGNLSGSESELTGLWIANKALITQLELYDPNALRGELERRMFGETNIHMRLLLASLACRRGSTAARDFLLECRAITDTDIAHSTIDAIDFSSPRDHPRPPWAQKALDAARKDTRSRRLRPSSWSSENPEAPSRTVADLTEQVYERYVFDANTATSRPVCSAAQIEAALRRFDANEEVEGKLGAFYSYQDLVALRLRVATEMKIGTDPAAWRYWWATRGKDDPRFRR